MSKQTITNLINHVAFVVDESGSMSGLENKTVEVFDGVIQSLVKTSKDLNQETRVSVYTFAGNITHNVVFDMDVMRMSSLKGYYAPVGGTPLVDAVLKSVADMKKLPEVYGDHAFLVYVLTDGEDNTSRKSGSELSAELKALPGHWTVVCLVPYASGIVSAKRYGFPAQNIQVWDTTERGMEEVLEKTNAAMTNYMVNRTTGTRGSSAYFTVDAVNITPTAVKTECVELVPDQDYEMIPVRPADREKLVIRPFVETWTKQPYRMRSAYFQLTKKETVQHDKQLIIQNKASGKTFAGDKVREMLGIPNAVTYKVAPGNFGDWRIFVQSGSVNRNLMPGTDLILRK